MRGKIITTMLLIIATIHLLPLVGVLGASRLEALYGISIGNSDLELLMRHRAVLFGLLASFFAYAGFKADLQPLALVGSFLSVSSFFFLAAQSAPLGAAMWNIVWGDVIAAICWLVATGLYFGMPAKTNQ